MTNVVAENGPQIIGKLALIIGVAYLGYLIHVVVVYGLSVTFLSKMNPITFFKGHRPCHDHGIYHHILQRNTAGQYRVLQ